MASLLQLLPDRVTPCAAAEAPLRFLFDASKLLNGVSYINFFMKVALKYHINLYF